MKKSTKKKTLTAVTSAAVIGAATVALGNASSLETLFNPDKFEKYENRHRSDEYDYVSGNGTDAEVADKKENGEDGTSEEKDKQILHVTEQEQAQSDEKDRAQEENNTDLGIAEKSADDPSADKNKNAAELVPAKDSVNQNTTVVPAGNTSGGNGKSTGGQSGTDNDGQSTDKSEKKAKTDNGKSDNTATVTTAPVPTTVPIAAPTAVPTAVPTATPTVTPTATPTATPTPKPESWEDKQLKPKDPTVTEDGTLTGLKVGLTKKTYAIGDSFSAEDAEVTAVFSNTDGSTSEKTLDYGENGYTVSFDTRKRGRQTAVFKYNGISVRVQYQVLSNYATLNYMALYNNEYYSSTFPGAGLKTISEEDYQELIKLGQFPNVYPSVGNVIDLMEAHRRMIAYLEDERIKNIFGNTVGGNYNSTVFLSEENGYLTNMLQGFRYILSKNIYDNRSYVYYPGEGWDTEARNLVNMVTDVPEGYWLCRVTENEGSLKDYIGDQVLEKYTGGEKNLDVPMGTTVIDLKEKAEQVTRLLVPQSVWKINTESIADNLPNLENYSYAEGDTDTTYGDFKIEDGLLFSKDGKTLLSVPAGRKTVTIPSTVTRLAANCFKGLAADAVITFESEKPPTIEGETGFKGTILTPDSDYDVVCKAYMFQFAQENQDIRFADISDGTAKYTYIEDGPVLVSSEDTSVLMGIPQDTKGRYLVSETIRTIGSGAFAGCKNATDIELPETVTKLEDESLAAQNGVTSVTLKGSDTQVSAEIFGDPEKGAEVPDITVWVNQEDYEEYLNKWSTVLDPVYGEGTAAGLLKASTDHYVYEDGAKYAEIVTENGTGYRLLKLYANNKRSLVIKEGTVEIAANTFGENDHLEILCIPESVKVIGAGAFENCSALETVTCADRELTKDAALSDTVELLDTGSDFASFTMENEALYGTDTEGNQTLINVNTDYQGELQVNKNTKALYKEALKNCTGITTIEFADEKLEKIGDGCFAGCSQFNELDFSGYSNLTEIGAGAFEECTGLTKVSLPETVTELEESVFRNCTSLESMDASNIQAVGTAAFYNCSSLADTGFIENTDDLGDEAFYGCRSLTEIELPDTLSQMGESCFENCIGLKKITINGTLTGISRYCFYGCRALKDIAFGDTLARSSSVRVIGVEAFGQCVSLEEIDLEGQTSLTRMGTGAFRGCISLAKVVLPVNLEKIPDGCFNGCSELSILQSSADTVVEPGAKIFGDTLPSFIHVWVKESMADNYKAGWKTVIDADYGEGTTENIIDVINEKIEIVKGVVFEITENGRILKEASPDAIPEEYSVPEDTIEIADDAFNGCTRLKALEFPMGASISLGDRCFKGCTGLEKIYMYSAIPQWGEEVFMNCTGLKKIYIGQGDGAEIPRIGTRAFMNCTGLEGESPVEIRSATSVWGEECFAGCTALKSIGTTEDSKNALEVLEDGAMRGCTSLRVLLNSKFSGLRKIGNYVFENCDSLSGPSIPAGVTSIGEGCFMNCDNITTISFYGALEEYPKDCFKNCPKLTRTGGTAAAFAGLKRIGEGAYEGCTSLVTSKNWYLERYANLESIGDRAFSGCVSLGDSTLGESVQSIGNNAFDGCVSMHTLTIKAVQTPVFGTMDLISMSDDFGIRVPDSQSSEDSVYKAYLEVLKSILGEEDALRILDSVSDGAKDRYAEELAKEAEKLAETEENKEETEENVTEESKTEEINETTEEQTENTDAEENQQQSENVMQYDGEAGAPEDVDSSDSDSGEKEIPAEETEAVQTPDPSMEPQQESEIQETKGETE